MTSTNIYQPYTYLIGWTAHNKWYYGCQYHKKANPDDLWKLYFTSSVYVKQFREQYGEPDVVQIRKVFSDALLTKKCEDRVLLSIPIELRENWLNKKFGGGFKGVVDSIERRISISNKKKGLVLVKDLHGNKFVVSKHDRRFLDGELVGVTKGTVTVKDSEGNYYRIMCNDPRRITGELVGVSKGTIVSDEFRRKCGAASLGRRHSKETKDKMSKSKLGTIKSLKERENLSKIYKGSAPAKDRTGTPLGNIHKTDPRWATGEIVGVNKHL